MNWDATLGVASVIAFTLPIAVIFYNRYYTHRSLAALLAYYAFILIDNLFGTIINSATVLARVINYIDKYTNIPLILTALLFFCASKQRQGKIRLLTLIFVTYEIVIIAVYGFTLNSIIYIMGPGVGVVLLYSFYLFVRQIKFSIFHGKNHGRVLMLISIVFDFSCYGLIYFFQYIQKTPFQNDVFRLYYISSIVSSVLMAIGLHMMRVRMKELQSLKTTRKDLAIIFGH